MVGRSRPPMASASDWDRRYQRCPDAYGVAPNSFLVEMADKIPRGSRVLMLGEGEGRNAHFLREERDAKCLAVDWSQVATSRCRRRGIEAVCCDVTNLPQGLGQFDCLVVVFCAPSNLSRALRDAFAKVRPGGIGIVELFAEYDSEVGPSSDRICDADDVVAILEPAEVVTSRTTARVVLEGKYHASLTPRRVAQVVVRAPQPHSSFLSKMDDVFDGGGAHSQNRRLVGRSEDKMLRASGELVAASVAAMDGCRYCWAPSCRCQPATLPWARRVVVLCHPNEFLRSTSTGRLLASVCGAQFKLYGEELPPDYKILYPSEDAVDFYDDGSTTVVVPDGSWKQTQAMMTELPSGRSVRLRFPSFPSSSSPSSDVLDACTRERAREDCRLSRLSRSPSRSTLELSWLPSSTRYDALRSTRNDESTRQRLPLSKKPQSTTRRLSTRRIVSARCAPLRSLRLSA